MGVTGFLHAYNQNVVSIATGLIVQVLIT
jgi:hypothetical protein